MVKQKLVYDPDAVGLKQSFEDDTGGGVSVDPFTVVNGLTVDNDGTQYPLRIDFPEEMPLAVVNIQGPSTEAGQMLLSLSPTGRFVLGTLRTGSQDAFAVFDPDGNALFRINGDGSVHIKTGTSIVADL
jgi:hypothetical protein